MTNDNGIHLLNDLITYINKLKINYIDCIKDNLDDLCKSEDESDLIQKNILINVYNNLLNSPSGYEMIKNDDPKLIYIIDIYFIKQTKDLLLLDDYLINTCGLSESNS